MTSKFDEGLGYCFYAFVCQGGRRERVTGRAGKGLLATLAATKLDRDAFVLPAVRISVSYFSYIPHPDAFPLGISLCRSLAGPKRGTVPETDWAGRVK